MLLKGILPLLILALLSGCVTREQQIAYENELRLRKINSTLQRGGAILFYPVQKTSEFDTYHIPINTWEHKEGYVDEWVTSIENEIGSRIVDLRDETNKYPTEFFIAKGTRWIMASVKPGDYYLKSARVHFEPHQYVYPNNLSPSISSGAFFVDFINTEIYIPRSKQVWDSGASHQELKVVAVDSEGNAEADWVNVVDREAGYVKKGYMTSNESVKRDLIFDKNQSLAEFTLEPGKVYVMMVNFKFDSPDRENYRGPFMDSKPCVEISLDTVKIKTVKDKSQYRCTANSLAYGVDENLTVYFDKIANKLLNQIKVTAPIEDVQFKYRGVIKGELYEKGVKEVFYEKSL